MPIISTHFPSRLDLASAMIKRYAGWFFLPTRINLIFNIIIDYIIPKAVLAASCSASCLLAPFPEAVGFPLTTTSAVKIL